MHGEIITIGNELIGGKTMDQNAWYAAGRLAGAGLRVTRITTVGDDPVNIANAVKRAIKESRFVIVTGGLGSTEDDITNQVVAKAMNRPLCVDERMSEQIRKFVGEQGIKLSPSLEKMARMPEGARMLNPEGLNCGFSLIEDGVHLYILPGVPDQMRYLMDRFVIPEMLDHFGPLPLVRQRILKLYGISEPGIAEILEGLSGRTEDTLIGFYPHFPENHMTINMRGQDAHTVTEALEKIEKEIRGLLGPFVFATGNQTMEGVVGDLLTERDLGISVAESCTGGLIGKLLTNVPGSSHYFQGGMIVYSNDAKIDLLDVAPETVEKYGAVSDQTVREMAEGVKKRLKTDLGLAVTGVAGPGGGTREKPVGTVYIGLAAGNETFSRKYRFGITRDQIRRNTSMMALDWVRRYLHGYPFLPGL